MILFVNIYGFTFSGSKRFTILPDENINGYDKRHDHQLQESGNTDQEAGFFLFLSSTIFRTTSVCTGHYVEL